MFRIEYKTVKEQLKEIEYISDEEIRYSFLFGNVSLISSDSKIEMDWEWIPLLDFAYSLRIICNKLAGDDNTKEYFEFTENSETIEFSRNREKLKIATSYSSKEIETSFEDFEKAVYDFHFKISQYILVNKFGELPSVLKEYLIM